jgi:L-arabinokinase
MDQMASSLGEAGWLLALRCQPAEVQGNVRIPDYMRFWGVDSGIRHSVGGSDYGAVRTGAFMGLKIASYFDASHSHHHHDAHNDGHSTLKEERIKVSGALVVQEAL